MSEVGRTPRPSERPLGAQAAVGIGLVIGLAAAVAFVAWLLALAAALIF